VRIASVQPNPFSNAVTVRIQDARSERAVLTVYDVRGRRVRVIQGGGDTMRWDGRNERGAHAPAGVYWLRVSDGAGSDARRVVVVR